MRPPHRIPFSIARSFHSSPVRNQLQLAHQVFHPTRSPAAKPQSNPIIFIHGLFGSKQNNRSVSKVLSNQLNTPVITLDLRNHGDSPHHPEHTYSAMADDVESFIRTSKFEKPVLIGHSMGAKTAMAVALRSPDLISALIPVDNGPGRAALDKELPKDVGGFPKYIEGLREIEKARVTKQSDADVILKRYEEVLGVRQFLLTNLVRSKEDNTLKSRIPLDILGGALRGMADFPFTASDNVKFEGPTLFIRGSKSFYVNDKVVPLISHFFPNYRLVTVNAGHWLISENPWEFQDAVLEFLRSRQSSQHE